MELEAFKGYGKQGPNSNNLNFTIKFNQKKSILDDINFLLTLEISLRVPEMQFSTKNRFFSYFKLK